MHILLTPSWYPTPDSPINGAFFREQALALKKAGHTVGVIAPQLYSLTTLRESRLRSRCGPLAQDDEGVLTYRRCGWRWFPRLGRANASLWIRAGLKLYKRYAQTHGHPDIIHAHSALNGGILAARLKNDLGIPTVITEHVSCLALKSTNPYRHKLARAAFAEANYRIAVSPRFGELLESEFCSDFRPWKYIPNLLNPIFQNASLDVCSRKNVDPFRFINIALLSENKGHRDLLEAFSLAFRGDVKTRLTIGGDGNIRQSLEARAHGLGIGGQVDFLGLLDRQSVKSELLLSHAFVLSSHFETFGVALIEALACGLPVIATRSGGPESIVTDTDGLLVAPRAPKELAIAMSNIRKNASRFDRDEIRQHCISRFGAVNVVHQLDAIYKFVKSGQENQRPL